MAGWGTDIGGKGIAEKDLGLSLIHIFSQCKKVEDIFRAKAAGKIAWVPCIEGAQPIENEVDRIDILYGLGIRQLGVCLLYTSRMELCRKQLLEDVKFLRFVTYWMAQHVRENAFRHNPLEVRTAKFILQVAQGDIFRFNLSQCADILETSYRHLLRVIKQMCTVGLLERKGNGYRILNREELTRLSQGQIHLAGEEKEDS